MEAAVTVLVPVLALGGCDLPGGLGAQGGCVSGSSPAHCTALFPSCSLSSACEARRRGRL